MDESTRRLQEISNRNNLFFVHIATEFINIKAMLEVLLTFEQQRLIDHGMSVDEARVIIESQVSEHQTRLKAETVNWLSQLEIEMDTEYHNP